jgi:catechol 2,3-dioxygenase-like lactoylglutathione lyase family enzyme
MRPTGHSRLTGALALTVVDSDATCVIYEHVLAMEAVTFGAGRRALALGCQQINLHKAGCEFEPKAKHQTSGSGDLCFLSPAAMFEVVELLRANGVAIVEGLVRRTGALGSIESVDFRVPDGTLVMVSNELDTIGE